MLWNISPLCTPMCLGNATDISFKSSRSPLMEQVQCVPSVIHTWTALPSPPLPSPFTLPTCPSYALPLFTLSCYMAYWFIRLRAFLFREMVETRNSAVTLRNRIYLSFFLGFMWNIINLICVFFHFYWFRFILWRIMYCSVIIGNTMKYEVNDNIWIFPSPQRWNVNS